MKRLFVLALALLSLTAHAQRRPGRVNHDGSISMNNGRNTVRINVGDSRDDRDMLYRMIRLEQAVRDLQDQVYELQVAPIPVPLPIPIPRRIFYVCSARFSFAGTVTARGKTELEARGNLSDACVDRSHDRFHCTNPAGPVTCERGEE